MAASKIPTILAYFSLLLFIGILLRQCSGQFFNPDTEDKAKEQLRRKVKSGFSTTRTQVSLTCGSEDILVHLNFTRPFKGIVHAGPKNSSCLVVGDGGRRYQLKVPLKESACGTHEVEPSGSFANTLTIRFHPSLELEGDEIKTIICRFGTGSLNIG